MKSQTMSTMGYLLATIGGVLVVTSGVFFYSYMQDILSTSGSTTTGGTSTATLTQALALYNGTANSPIFVGLTIFGLAFLVMGAIFVVGGHITENVQGRTLNIQPRQQEAYAPRTMPARACMKCGSLLYQNSAFCPNCGNPLGQAQPSPAPTPQ